MEYKTVIKYFNNKPIRAISDPETGILYYAVIDVVLAIRDTNNARRYWADQKRRHPELAITTKQMKMTARDNKNYLTDVMDEEAIVSFLKSVKYEGVEFSLQENQELFKNNEINPIKEYQLYKALENFEVGTVFSLQQIHYYLFNEEDNEAGQIRKVEASLGSFNFVPAQYLNNLLLNIDEMPINTFDEIMEKYIELGIAHPFNSQNGIALRIWLNHTLKYKLGKVVDWSIIDKEEYLKIKRKAPINPEPLFILLHDALKDDVNNADLFVKGLNHLYTYDI